MLHTGKIIRETQLAFLNRVINYCIKLMPASCWQICNVQSSTKLPDEKNFLVSTHKKQEAALKPPLEITIN